MILFIFCRWVCSLFLVLVVFLILVLNELFIELNWFYILLVYVCRVLLIFFFRCLEVVCFFWDFVMFFWVYFIYELGIVILWIKDVDDWYCIVNVCFYVKCLRLVRYFFVIFEFFYFFVFFFNFYFLGIWVIIMYWFFVNKKINKVLMFVCLIDFV